MRVYIAAHSGFCYGVKSAVEQTYKALESNPAICTYGELIHNRQVVEKLKSDHVSVIDDLDEHDGKLVIIRSHGVPPSVYDYALKNHIRLHDATCPYVKKIHRIVHEQSEKGDLIIIVGDPNHPEVVGISGWAGHDYLVIRSLEEVHANAIAIENALHLSVVAQTTITQSLWDDVVNAIESLNGNMTRFDTICAATSNRQKSTAELAKMVDLMIVIGGPHSSNSQKLFQISKNLCENTIYIETLEDLMMKDVCKYDNIGITAGASTPEWVIKEIVDKLENEGGVIING